MPDWPGGFFPSQALIIPMVQTPIAVVGSAWNPGVNVAHYLNSSLASSPGAQNDEAHWDVDLLAGTYRLDMLHRQGTSLGIYTFNFDSDSSFGTIDGYAGASASSKSSLTGIIVTGSGIHRLKVKLLTKNASSSGYQGNINAISLSRTGA